MKVLLTGGSGFIASHCIAALLQNGHEVVISVRSIDKGQQALTYHLQKWPDGQLNYVIVPDIAKEDAFKEALISDPPFEAVIHTASPFHFNVTDPKKDLLDPAVMGTIGILRAIQRGAPKVTRVVITSSFVAIQEIGKEHKKFYSESDWNSMTWDDALQSPGNAYCGSKKFAEEAAWKFIETERPTFDLAVINPPLVFGPILDQHHARLDGINTSNQRILNLIQGKWKQHGIPPTGGFLWVDVRDVAVAHIKAMESPAAGNQRFLVTAGHYSNAALVSIVRHSFRDLTGQLPPDCPSDIPMNVYGYDNSRSRNTLGLRYISLKDSIIDTIKSLRNMGF